jgi:hypothetical protein
MFSSSARRPPSRKERKRRAYLDGDDHERCSHTVAFMRTGLVDSKPASASVGHLSWRKARQGQLAVLLAALLDCSPRDPAACTLRKVHFVIR